MHYFFKLLSLFTVFCILSGCSVHSCNSDANQNAESLTVVDWNLQTFFDAQKDGTEYKEFQKNTDWNKEKYLSRLQKLCSVMTELNADIYVFQEMENQEIMYDISNQLAAGSWKQKNFWTYTCFSRPQSSAIGLAVFSRYELSNQNNYSLDIRTQKSSQPEMRYLLKVQVQVKDFPVNLFVNHWKSKSDGEYASNIWRDWQESQLAGVLLQNQELPCIICGDFNRNCTEFINIFDGQKSYNGNYGKTLLRNAGFDLTENARTIQVCNGWYDSYGQLRTQNGSYFFNEQWERIDNIFVTGKIKLLDFQPVCQEPFINSSGYPAGYSIYTGQGYSDHLPVKASLLLQK